MDLKQALPWMVLQNLPHMGLATQRKLLDKFGSPQIILKTPYSQWGVKVPPGLAKALSLWWKNPEQSPVQQRALRALDYIQKTDIKLLPLGCSGYPQLLAEIFDPPPLLYVQGQIETLSELQLAVVGSRKTSSAGRRAVRELVSEAVSCGLTITSGLALGIDGEAHRVALDTEGNTVAVLGTGIDICYPRKHQQLAEQIIERGALVTEFPPGSQPHRGSFPRRNRIISGLSLGVLVVEAGIPSGSLITARMALEQGREVFAVPGSIYNPSSRGCHRLIQEGAKLVESFSGIREELEGLGLTQLQALGRQDRGLRPLDADQEALIALVGYESVSVDHLVMASGLDVATVRAILTSLEINGWVEACAGGYMRT